MGTTRPSDLSGDWDGLVVIVAGVTYEGNRLGAQHIAERLTRYAPVLYVDPPRTPMSVRHKPWLAASEQEPRLRVIGTRLARLTPSVPPLKTRPVGRAVAGAVLRRQLRRAVQRLGGRVHAVVDIPPHYPVFGVCGESMRVHLASDDFLAGARIQGVSARWVEGQERRVAREVDTVVAVSPVLQEKWRALGHDPVLMTNGCDVELYAGMPEVQPALDVRLPRPVAGFIGTLSDRTDVSLLEAVATRGHSVLLIGPRSHTAPGAQLDRVLGMPNVQWVGRKDYREVPAYLRHVDVGVVPYADNEFNRASFPLKVLDYLAAGLPVVGNDLPSLRWLDTELVHLVSGANAFADAVGAALRAPRDEDLVRQRRAYASRHSWDARVATFARVLGLPGAPSASGETEQDVLRA